MDGYASSVLSIDSMKSRYTFKCFGVTLLRKNNNNSNSNNNELYLVSRHIKTHKLVAN